MWIQKLIQNLGGRKFLLSILAIGCGTAIEVLTVRGMTPAFAGVLTGIVAAFAVSNWASTREYYKAGPQKDNNNKQLQALEKRQEKVEQSLVNVAQNVHTMNVLIDNAQRGMNNGQNS